jgi:acetyl esterase/lipase
MKEFTDTPLWNSKLNAKMWLMYLKGVPRAKRAAASPAAAVSFAGIPPTYVEVSEYDCLRDEGIAFAKALEDSGIAVELCKTTGTIHGFEIAKHSSIVRESISRRIEALRKAFSLN